MMLLTKQIEAEFKKIGKQENVQDPIVVCKFFNPCSQWTWYATEYDPADKCFYGYVVGLENEWGYFTLDELQSYKGRLGLGIEREYGFRPAKFSELCKTQAYLKEVK